MVATHKEKNIIDESLTAKEKRLSEASQGVNKYMTRFGMRAAQDAADEMVERALDQCAFIASILKRLTKVDNITFTATEGAGLADILENISHDLYEVYCFNMESGNIEPGKCEVWMYNAGENHE